MLAFVSLCNAEERSHAVLFSNKLLRLEVDGEYCEAMKVSFRADAGLYPMQADELADFAFVAPNAGNSLLLIQSADLHRDGTSTRVRSIENLGALSLLECAGRRHDLLKRLNLDIRNAGDAPAWSSDDESLRANYVGPLRVQGGLAALRVVYRDRTTAILAVVLVKGDSVVNLEEAVSKVWRFQVEGVNIEPTETTSSLAHK